MTTIYCTVTELQSLMSDAFVTASVDDDEDGVNDAGEDTLVDDAIEQGAVAMNAFLQQRYTLSELTSNDWAKWCNATLAAECITARRGNPEMFVERAERYRGWLEDIADGKMPLPEASPTFDSRPTVSTFDVERWRKDAPVRVVKDQSTGPDPAPGVKRRTDRDRRFGLRDN